MLLVHDLIALDHPELCRPANRLHYALALPASIRRATALVTFSEHVRERIIDRFGRSPSDITVVPPGVDDPFHAPVGEETLRRVQQTYRLPPRFVLFAGTAEPKKNLARLIDAHRMTRQDGRIDGELVITRNAPPSVPSDGVRTLGFVPDADVPALFRLARVLAFPSLVEGFGLPVLEAMACGLPVVCSRVPAVEHSDPGAVILVEPTDVESIAAGLARAWQDEDLRNRMIARGVRATRNLRWSLAARTLWNLYAQIVQR